MKKKTILILIGYYLPGYKSGALRTIVNMVNLLGDEFNFKVITRNHDFGNVKPYINIKVNEWNEGLNCKIFYVNKKTNLREVINNTQFDQYYLNSLFDFNFSIKIVLLLKFRLIQKKKILLAPRGELMTGAIKFKISKKRIFLFFAEVFNIYSSTIWHASTEVEAQEIRKEIGNNIRIKIALDVPDYSLYDRKNKRNCKSGKLKILFISNIVPKKNLKFAIKVLNKIKGDFVFDIYGPIVDKEYWGECFAVVDPKIKDRVNYKGEVLNTKIHNIYPQYDFLFFPSMGENFGHVIWESLALKCPVLTTDNTPWQNLENFNLGWNISLDKIKKYIEIIEDIVTQKKKNVLKANSKLDEYINNFLDKNKILKENRILFFNDKTNGK